MQPAARVRGPVSLGVAANRCSSNPHANSGGAKNPINFVSTSRKTISPGLRPGLPKFATGIAGFDELSRGGLPQNRTTLLIGGPGSGKSVFALQCLVYAVTERKEPGVFVAFEERSSQIVANAASFDWGLARVARNQLFFLDAQLSPDIVQSGEFDLSGMLAMLKAKMKDMGARCIVFDGIDVLLSLLRDPMAEMREIYRIRDWLADNDATGIITAKVDGGSVELVSYGFLQFMVDCVVRLERRLEYGVALHRIQITKYRGSDFSAGEYPVNFGPSGMEVDAPEPSEIRQLATSERVSIGFARLDTMLGGGLFRGSSTLITGVPGTSKTTLAGKFAEAACLRGERTLFVSFDESAARIASNLTSVGIHLQKHVDSGLLLMYSGRTEAIGSEGHLVKIKSLIREHQPRCMVIDPLSAIAKSGGLVAARFVANRFIYLAKDEQITVLVTAINEQGDEQSGEATDLQISTIADTWINLSYLIRSGERNRALTIIKSRGTWHSNQVRELILGESGPMLADVFTAGGEVLMGTLRWEKEDAERVKTAQRLTEFDLKHGALEIAEADTLARIKALELDLKRQRLELELYSTGNDERIVSSSDREKELRRIRSGDEAANGAADPGLAVRASNGSGKPRSLKKPKPGVSHAS